jgi:hypothetical protein
MSEKIKMQNKISKLYSLYRNNRLSAKCQYKHLERLNLKKLNVIQLYEELKNAKEALKKISYSCLNERLGE